VGVFLSAAMSAEPWGRGDWDPRGGERGPWNDRYDPYFRSGRSQVKTCTKRAAPPDCAFPWSYSQGLGCCVCTHVGYRLQQGACAPDGASVRCADNECWSGKEGACVCAKGLHREGGTCVEAALVTAAITPSDEQLGNADPAPGEDPRAEATKRAQRCFSKGPTDGVANTEKWIASSNFKHANELARYKDFVAGPVQQKIADCKVEEETAVPARLSTPEPSQPAVTPEPPETPQPASPAPAVEGGASPNAAREVAPETEPAPETEQARAPEAAAPEPPASPAKERSEIDCLPEDLLSVPVVSTETRRRRAPARPPACLHRRA
jgi:hypothetical protein